MNRQQGRFECGRFWRPVRFLTGALTLAAALPLAAGLSAAERPDPSKVVSPEEAWRIGWPNYFGPHLNLCAQQSGQKLVDHYTKIRHLWRSEERVAQSKANNARDPARYGVDGPWLLPGGAAMPIMADGRVYQQLYRPNDTRVDPIDRYGGTRGDGTFWTYEQRQAVERNGCWRDGCLGADDVMICMDAATGRTLWIRTFPDAAFLSVAKDPACTHTPCVAGGRLFFVGSSYRLYALDARSGELLWRSQTDDYREKRDILNHGRAEVRRGIVGGGGAQHGSDVQLPILLDDLLYIGTEGGGLQAFDVETGQVRWTRLDLGMQPAPRVWHHGERDFLLCRQRDCIVCLDAKTGQQRWQMSAGPINDSQRNFGNPGYGRYMAISGDVMVIQQVVYLAELSRGQRKHGTNRYHAFRLTETGATKIWDSAPRRVGGGGFGLWRPTTMANGDFFLSGMLADVYERVDARTGEVTSRYCSVPRRSLGRPIALDDPWVYGRGDYNAGVIVNNDSQDAGQYPEFSWLKIVPDEGLYFNSTYGYPGGWTYAAGILFERGNYNVHAFDLRAEPKPLPTLQALPAWASELPEAIRPLASQYRSERLKTLADLRALTDDQRARLTDALVKLVAGDDRLIQRSAIEALALSGFDRAKTTPALSAAIGRALDVGHGEIAASMSVALAKLDASQIPAVADLAATKLTDASPAVRQAGCAALAALGPDASGHAKALAPLAGDDNFVTALAAMSALATVDKDGTQSAALAAQLTRNDNDRRYAAAEALAGMGPGAAGALVGIRAELRPVRQRLSVYSRTNNAQQEERLWARRLAWALARLGDAGIKTLRDTVEGLSADSPDRAYLLACLAEAGAAAVPTVLDWWKGGDSDRRGWAITTVNFMVRQGKPLTVIQLFLDAVVAEKDPSMQVRVAVWRLLLDPADKQGLTTLMDLCANADTPDDVRTTAAQRLSQLIVRPHLAFPDDARRRAASLLVKLVDQGKASAVVAMQMKGMTQWLDDADRALIENVRVETPKFWKRDHRWW
jgi:outer membrane protein assembly factor BamB